MSLKMDISLSPFYASFANSTYFVAMRYISGVYELFLFHDFIKRFTTATMPDEIKPKLAMINSLAETPLREEGTFQEIDMYTWHMFLYEEQEEFKDIGWRVSPEMYVLILTQDEINKLQGVDV